MLDFTPEEFVLQLSEAVERKKLSLMDSPITLFSTFCYKEETEKNFSEILFKKIIDLMNDENFQKLPNTHKIFLIFQYDWGKLNSTQKKLLIESITDSYGKFTDDLSHFVLAELLGEYFADRKAKSVLDIISNTDNEKARAFVAYGYRKLFNNSIEDVDKQDLLNKLKRMLKDKSIEVRDEAAISINKINSL